MTTDHKICEHCQYFRLKKWQGNPNAPEPPWCSNSKSPKFWQGVASTDTCPEFTLRSEGKDQDAEELSQRANKAFTEKR